MRAKLDISEPGDALEREADRVAEHVVSSRDSDAAPGIAADSHPRISRAPAPAAADGAGTAVVEDGLRSAGRTLDAGTRNFMESRFGHDFSNVRVHTDSAASRSAQAVNARAYTTGEDIVFRTGEYDPASQGGRRLLAHELTHVVQQRASPGLVQRAPSFDDCSTGQQTVITAAIATGTTRVTRALAELRSAASGSMSTHCGTLLTRDFHTHAASDIAKIITGFDAILAGLTGSITYQCESWCMGEKCGYVYAIWTDVHFCPSFFSSAASAAFQARCLVHELAHREAGAGGDTYEYDAGYPTLSPADAIENADSYAVFARDI